MSSCANSWTARKKCSDPPVRLCAQDVIVSIAAQSSANLWCKLLVSTLNATKSPISETVQIPSKLVATTSAQIVLTAVMQVIESFVTLGIPFLDWLRGNCFQTVMFILVVDQAAYNGLAYKMLLCAQLILLPCTHSFLHLEPCGLHMGVRALVGHLDRTNHQKLLRAVSRSLRAGKNHDKICDVIPRVVAYKTRFYLGPPPFVHPSAAPECKTLLLKMMMMNEHQKAINANNPVAAVEDSRRNFHLTQVLSLLNCNWSGKNLSIIAQGRPVVDAVSQSVGKS